jgi:hypothetical protein
MSVQPPISDIKLAQSLGYKFLVSSLRSGSFVLIAKDLDNLEEAFAIATQSEQSEILLLNSFDQKSLLVYWSKAFPDRFNSKMLHQNKDWKYKKLNSFDRIFWHGTIKAKGMEEAFKVIEQIKQWLGEEIKILKYESDWRIENLINISFSMNLPQAFQDYQQVDVQPYTNKLAPVWRYDSIPVIYKEDLIEWGGVTNNPFIPGLESLSFCLSNFQLKA